PQKNTKSVPRHSLIPDLLEKETPLATSASHRQSACRGELEEDLNAQWRGEGGGDGRARREAERRCSGERGLDFTSARTCDECHRCLSKRQAAAAVCRGGDLCRRLPMLVAAALRIAT